MESVSLGMDDIFGEDFHGEGDDEDEALPPRLPDLPEHDENDEQAANNDDTDNQEVLAKLKGMKGASKNTVKRPQPKLDTTRLTGERGIPILPHIFKDVKLKGKGHEAQDLRIVMKYLEHWAHRLFPKMPFDEVLERIERLGTKREVQTCIKKMRMDMPVLGSDTVDRDGDEDEAGENQGGATQQQQHQTQQEKTAADMFDKLIREEEELMQASGEGQGRRGESNAAGRQTQRRQSDEFEEFLREEEELMRESGQEQSRANGNGASARQSDPFEELLREEEAMMQEGGHGNGRQNSQAGEGSAAGHSSTGESSQSVSSGSSSAKAANGSTPSSSGGLSAEVLAKIERNKRLAMERRANKTGGSLSQATPPKPSQLSQSPSQRDSL